MVTPIWTPPRPTVHFTGRARELLALEQSLVRYPVIVVTGLAGIGKTTLAARLAHELPPDADPLWVRVRAEPGGDDLLAELVKLVALPPTLDPEPQARALAIVGALERAGRVLFVDDLHKADDPAGRGLVETFVRYARRARLVATARAIPELDAGVVADVHVLPLGGLSEAESRMLLASLLDETAAPLVATLGPTLLRQTGGHPHFIRHLAGYLGARGLSAADLTAGRAEAFVELEDFLAREVITRLPRDERVFVGVLAVAEGPVPAAVVAGAWPECARVYPRIVRSLVRRGLVEPQDDGTIGLHAQVREAALACMEPSERRRVEAALGEEILGRAGRDPGAVLAALGHLLVAGQVERVAREVGGVLEAAYRAGHLGRILHLLEGLERASGPLPPRLAIEKARVLKIWGAYDQALGPLLAHLARARGEDRQRLHSEIGDIHNYTGDYRGALEHYQAALALARRRSDAGTVIDCENDMAALLLYLGQMSKGQAICRRTLARARELGDRAREADVLNNLAVAMRHQGRLRAAEELYRECLALDERAGDLTNSARTLHNLGVVYAQLDRPHDALAQYERSLAQKELVGFGPGMAHTLRHMAEVALSQGDTAKARAYATRAEGLVGRGDRVVAGYIQGTQAMIEAALGAPARAHEMLLRAIALIKGLKAPRLALGLYRRLGEVALAQGQTREAVRWLQRALGERSAMDETVEVVSVYRVLAHARLMAGDVAAARLALDQARATLASEGMGRERASIEILEMVVLLRGAGRRWRGRTVAASPPLAALQARLAAVLALPDPPAAAQARRLMATAFEAAGRTDDARAERSRLLDALRAPGEGAPSLAPGTGWAALLASVEEGLERLGCTVGASVELFDPQGRREVAAREAVSAMERGGSLALLMDLARPCLFARGHLVPGFFAKKVQGALLATLMRSGQDALTKRALYEAAWQARYNPEIHDNTLYVRINHLRQLLRPLVGQDPIQTREEPSTYRLAPGVSYLLVAPL